MVMKRKIIVLIVLLFCLPGCAHWLEVYQEPPGSENFLPSEIGVVIPAILKAVEVRVNGNEVDPDPEFVRLILQKIRRTYIFSEINLPEDASKMKMREKAVRLWLLVDSKVNMHETANLLKFAATCASLFLLSPVLSLTDDFDATITFKAVRYDGEEKYYKSRMKGTNHYSIFNTSQSRRHVRTEVTEKTLNSLMRQIMKDIDFFAMKD